MRTFYYKNKILFKSIFVAFSLFVIIILPIILLLQFQKNDPGFNLKDPKIEFLDDGPKEINSIIEDDVTHSDWYFNIDRNQFNGWEISDYYVAISNKDSIINLDYGKDPSGNLMLWTNNFDKSSNIIKKTLAFHDFQNKYGSDKNQVIEDIKNSHGFTNDYNEDNLLLEDITDKETSNGWTIFMKAKFVNKYSPDYKVIDYYDNHDKANIKTTPLTPPKPPETYIELKAPTIDFDSKKKELSLELKSGTHYLFSNVHSQMYPLINIGGVTSDMLKYMILNDPRDPSSGNTPPKLNIIYHFENDNGDILDQTCIEKDIPLDGDGEKNAYNKIGNDGIEIPKEAYNDDLELEYKKILVSGNIKFQYKTKRNIQKQVNPGDPDSVEVDDPDGVVDGEEHIISFGEEDNLSELTPEDETLFSGALNYYKVNEPKILVYPHWDEFDTFEITFLTKDKYIFNSSIYSFTDAKFTFKINLYNKYGDKSLSIRFQILPVFKKINIDENNYYVSTFKPFSFISKKTNYFLEPSSTNLFEGSTTSQLFNYEHLEKAPSTSYSSKNYIFGKDSVTHNYKDFDGAKNMLLLPDNIEILKVDHKFKTKPFVLVITLVVLLLFIIPVLIAISFRLVKMYIQRKE